MKFNERLKALREDNDITQAILAQKVKVDQRSISFYEKGKFEPKIETITAIAKEFNVSTDYLLGLTNNPKKFW